MKDLFFKLSEQDDSLFAQEDILFVQDNILSAHLFGQLNILFA